MTKRKRANENERSEKEASSDQAARSNQRFRAFINRWREDVEDPSAVRHPSSLRPLCPLPTLLEFLAPRSPHRSNVGTFTKESTQGAIAACEGVSGTGVVYDEYMLQHVSPDPRELERPSRLQRTIAHLTAVGLLGCCVRLNAKKATTRDLRRVHTKEHIDYVDQLDFFMQFKDDGSMSVGQDLYACESTSKVARMAAGSVVEAALAVTEGRVRNAFAFVRPPGHHACAELPSGFCFFNNVAVAARAVQEKLSPDSFRRKEGKPRVLILDWDVHHCDGTESIFYEDPSIMVISIHQYAKRRGHILRKPSSRTEAPSNTADQSPPEPTTDLSVEALGKLLPTDEEMQRWNGECADVLALPKGDPDLPATTEKRVHGMIDYNKLAAELIADDNEAAAMLGVDLSGSSATGSETTSTDSSGGSETGMRGGPACRHAGDTEGLSLNSKIDSSSLGLGSEELFYPGTGHLNRIGGEQNAAARGRNLNIPWPTHGMGDLEYLHVLNEIVVHVMMEFSPQVVIISCGFDSASGDLLGSMNLTPSGYYMMTKCISRHAPRLVVALEGGYHVSNIALCSEAVLRALLEDSMPDGAPALPRSRMLLAQSNDLIQSIKEQYKGVLKCFSNAS
ncbi:unnamed protein product [Phytomonas sp. Hart1]|nr:unnamed protein product [Phytomonas sp. Hart1]|eukprot:CCW72062.1 unnamed protein product [Phytomonas sp. isolate Hart1]